MWKVLKANEALSSLLRAALWAPAFQVPLQLLSLVVEVGPVGECVEEGRGREEPSPSLWTSCPSSLALWQSGQGRVMAFPDPWCVSACTANTGTVSSIPGY